MKKNVVLCMSKSIISLDIRLTFSRNNFNVIADFKRGEDLINYILRQDSVDLIIMDAELGGSLDGYETAAEVLKMDDRIKIVFISAGGSGIYKKEFMLNNRTLFLKMPFVSDDIAGWLNG